VRGECAAVANTASSAQCVHDLNAGCTRRLNSGHISAYELRMRKHLNPLRLAAVLLVLYCVGHTTGALLSTPDFGPASDGVVSAMKAVHFQVQGSDCTWFGFYEGFGWLVSVFFLFSAVVAWLLGGVPREGRRSLAIIIWALFASHLADAILAYRYFFLPPMIFSTAIAALLAVECVAVARSGRGPQTTST
jgi:hypothetical protein